MRCLIRKVVFAVGLAEIAGPICFPWISPGSKLAQLLRLPGSELTVCLLAVLAIVLAVDYWRDRPQVERSQATEYARVSLEADAQSYWDRAG